MLCVRVLMCLVCLMMFSAYFMCVGIVVFVLSLVLLRLSRQKCMMRADASARRESRCGQSGSGGAAGASLALLPDAEELRLNLLYCADAVLLQRVHHLGQVPLRVVPLHPQRPGDRDPPAGDPGAELGALAAGLLVDFALAVGGRGGTVATRRLRR